MHEMMHPPVLLCTHKYTRLTEAIYPSLCNDIQHFQLLHRPLFTWVLAMAVQHHCICGHLYMGQQQCHIYICPMLNHKHKCAMLPFCKSGFAPAWPHAMHSSIVGCCFVYTCKCIPKNKQQYQRITHDQSNLESCCNET